MAYAVNPQEQQTSTTGSAAQPLANQIGPVPGQPVPVGNGAPSTPTAGAGNKTPQPGTAQAPVNLRDYIAANTANISATGNQVANTLQNQYNSTYGDINNAAQGFQTGVNTATTPGNTSLNTLVTSNPTSLTPEQQIAFNKSLTASYTGPTDFTTTNPFSTVQSEAQNAATTGQAITAPGGLQSYLKTNVEKNPTAQITNLDTALLQASPTTISNINSKAGQLSTLPDYLTNQVAPLNAAATNGQATTNQAAQDAQAALTTAGTNLSTKVTQELNAANTSYDSKVKVASSLSAGKVPSDSDMTSAGLSDATINQIKAQFGILTPTSSDMDKQMAYYANVLNQVYSQTNTALPNWNLNSATNNATANTVATPEDYATAAALANLAGLGTPSFQFTPALAPANSNLAGTYTAPTFNQPAEQTTLSGIQGLVKANDDTELANYNFIKPPAGSKVQVIQNSPITSFFHPNSAQGNPNGIGVPWNLSGNSLINAIKNPTGSDATWFNNNGGLTNYLSVLAALDRQGMLSSADKVSYNNAKTYGVIDPVTGKETGYLDPITGQIANPQMHTL